MWDKKYGRDGYLYGTAPNDFLRDHLSVLPKGRILCLADGEGRNSVYLAQQGFDVTAVDQSAVGIEKGRALARDAGVDLQFVVADLADFDMGTARWAGVVSIFCHLPPTLRRDVHNRAAIGLAAGGVMLLEGYRAEQLQHDTGGPPVSELMHKLDDLRRDFNGFEFRHLANVEREIFEGNGHRGLGATAQMIAVKPS